MVAGVHFLIFYFFDGFDWVLVHPHSKILWGSPEFVLFQESHTLKKYDLLLLFDSFAVNSRNHYQYRHPDPYRIEVGTQNP